MTEPTAASSSIVSEASEGPRRLPLPRWTVPVVGVLVLLVAGVALVVMWRWVDSLALADPEKKATTQLEVIKAASGIAIGGGGLFALYLAARRQRTQELELEVRHDELRNRQVELVQRDRTQEHAERTAEVTRLHAEQVAADARHDAAERRLTELYTKAAEQFGSDNVAVQLAGLYGFERLANDHPELRQTVVNVICSLLRMPAPSADDAATMSKSSQVRGAALRILQEHLTQGAGKYWAVGIDLSGARLKNLDLAGWRVEKGLFVESAFVDACDITGLSTVEELNLTGATFEGVLMATQVHIGGALALDGAKFLADVDFGGSGIVGPVSLAETTFSGFTSFAGCRFGGSARCSDSAFFGPVEFTGVTFNDAVEIKATSFEGEVSFRGTYFEGPTRISDVTFLDEVWFNNSEFTASTPLLSAVQFSSDVWFHGVGLSNGILFHDVWFEGAADLGDCDDAGASDIRARRVPLFQQWPTNWEESEGGDEEWRYFADNAGSRELEFAAVLWNFAQD